MRNNSWQEPKWTFRRFGQVLPDILDYQSIEATLSTLSAHVSIREVALDVTPASLVLLDEPEGGALAVGEPHRSKLRKP